ncbi:MAG: pantoate--beta-alanine ligase [Nocardioidaceae bacterium]
MGAVEPDNSGGVEDRPVVASTRPELGEALSLSGGASSVGDRGAGASDAQPQLARVALVPTMGALHEGHAALMQEARRRADRVVVSIFVNPLQFGSTEDLSRYPRTLSDDVALCARHGVDIVFAPGVEEIYPGGEPMVTVDPGPLGGILEGAVRPGHFSGVLTVVAKLLNLVAPDLTVFGEKDYQQLVLVQQMAHDLCLGVDVIGVPTVRESDGLALSSRNRYLSAQQREAALTLSRALEEGQAARDTGAAGVLAAARQALAGEPSVKVDYLALRSTDLTTEATTGAARLLVAAKVGTTRLIDNVALSLGTMS